MNYYPHHIGDFNNATRHLDRIERSIYLDLIHFYYDIEGPIPDDIEMVAKKILASEHLTSVEQMLNEFLTLDQKGWSNARCDAVIADYKDKQKKKVKAGRASAKARKANNVKGCKGSTSVQQVLSKCATNQEPITNNQKPITNNQNTTPAEPVFNFKQSLVRLGIDTNLADEWIAVRRKKRATNSQTALKGFLKQCDIANLTPSEAVLMCVEYSWASFRAEWLKSNERGDSQKTSFLDKYHDKSWAN